ncbi:MAG: hypothetical protein V1798_10900 [Pseudomonadota bacterium]
MKPTRLSYVIAFLSGLAMFGCGAAATLPPDGGLDTLRPALNQAVWHPEFGDQIQVSPIGVPVALENGSVNSDAVSINVPDGQSSYVHGVFLLDVPDEDGVSISAYVGFTDSATDGSSARFTIYIQDEGRFVSLAELTASKDGQLDTLIADLSAYRGQNRMLVLSASSDNGAPLLAPMVWATPQLYIP